MVFLTVFLLCPGYCQTDTMIEPINKTLDINNNGKIDVWGHSSDNSQDINLIEVDNNEDGNPDIFCQRNKDGAGTIQADTNYDGKPDVLIATKDGQFQYAEADTDYDGTPDKKFSDVKEFNAWLTDKNPKLKEGLDKTNISDWTVTMLRF